MRPALRVAAAGALFAAALGGVAAAAAALLARQVRRAEREASAPTRDAADQAKSRLDVLPPADAIVVFGALAQPQGPSPELRARLDHAVRLWRLGVAPRIVVGGGLARGVDEVDSMTEYLASHGVPSDAVVPARPGDNTRVLLHTLAQLGYASYVAVSSPYHAHRIAAEGRRQGLRLRVSAPASTPETCDAAMHRARIATELAASVFYALPPAWASRVHTGPGSLRHIAPRVIAGRLSPSLLLPGRRAAELRWKAASR